MIIPIESPDQSFLTPNFKLGVWVQGAPVAGDAAPTTLVSVPANRIVKAVPRSGSLFGIGLGRFHVFVVGGTSISTVPWFYDAALAKWVAFAVAFSVNAGATTGLIMPLLGAQLYYQIVSQAGGVTAVGYDFF